MSPRDLSPGGGIELHAKTLIGPARLDFLEEEVRRDLVYFSAEVDFSRRA